LCIVTGYFERLGLSGSATTIRDVARLAGFSVASVSRVLNGHATVTPETREKVLNAVKTLGYTPNIAARSLSTARTHALGVVLPDMHGEFFSELLRGMERAAREHGYLLLLSNIHADAMIAGQVLNAMRGRVDGMIVMAPQLAEAERESALPRGLPVVLINSPGSQGHASLRTDNTGGMTEMVAHLLATGRRRIVHLSGMLENIDANERQLAYREAMARLAPDLPVRVLEGNFDELSGERLTRQLLDEGLPADALLAANDMMALGALQTLRQAGVAVPDRVAVAGFDDVPLARYLDLTSISVDIAGLGARAVEVLVGVISGQSPSLETEFCKTRLVLRATTQPRPA
jgi:LacI family transcriptional regulator